MVGTLGFFTQHELDPLVGYRRRRERMEGRTLPTGARVKTFAQEPIIFPEFAVMGLVLGEETVSASLRASAQRLYETTSFKAMADVVKRTAHGRKGWTLVDLAVALLDDAADDFLAWRAQVAQVLAELAERDIRMHVDLGRIQEVTATGYLVSLIDSGEVIKCALNATRAQLPTGIWVTRDVVELGAQRGEVLMPTVGPDILETMREKQTVATEEEQGFDELFRNVDFQPAAIPQVRDTVGRTESGGDLVRPRRRLRVNANRALYANANSMARTSQQVGPAR